jgi:endonuclease YncB( thermonuclease family)
MERMIRAVVVVIAACTAVAAQPQDVARLVKTTFEARVIRIADGDSLEVTPIGQLRPVRVRLLGVDSPELGEPFSNEAMALLRTLLLNQQVRVSGHDVDRYDRLVARVSVFGKDASTELVRAGLSCHAYARDAALADDEARARASGAGFWAAAAAKPACVTQTAYSAPRRGASPTPQRTQPSRPRSTAGSGAVRGNVTSLVYHAATCPNFRCRNCTRLFDSAAHAEAAGFKPAGDCFRPQRR